MTCDIQPAALEHKQTLYQLFMDIARAGEAFMHDGATSYEEWHQFWFSPGSKVWVALLDGAIAGSYVLRPNQPGVGKHVANGSYMVSSAFRGLKVGWQMGLQSIDDARQLGYQAMQFNAVVSHNAAAVALWKKLGFRIVGTNPKAFRHAALGLVDTYTMYREVG